MLIPHLHFKGNCEKAIALYEKAFDTKVDEIVRFCDYDPEKWAGDNRIAHANMKIKGQAVFLNDNDCMFGNEDTSLNFPVHLIVQFQTSGELLACYEILRACSIADNPFVKTFYSELVGNFKDKFGMLWGFMVV
ncbi:MAG: VOC family protein [Defluviitaleaceae bacterium]|nr:VOC family protein [Defluviitaleaceae bacterium]